MAEQMALRVVLVLVSLAGVMGGAEVSPTRVSGAAERTKPPTEGARPQYVQTLYKNTEQQVVVNTVEPLWPSYEVSYYSTKTTAIGNQTISTSQAEFATVLNSTVDYYTDLSATNTWDVAPTTYQTMDFQHQRVTFTDAANVTHTTVENNDLPFV
ncbi:uncharacterized protein LOC125041963 [Penaeus chinensis]|uniref:uncharacterized protein LOC125041963 n=1 Tax=Penaeus chinensis TaxID=139456 RepID=UPI001FB691ED|nr:uncharacterized protein LOC125041963 [Penaeus chinensis]